MATIEDLHPLAQEVHENGRLDYYGQTDDGVELYQDNGDGVIYGTDRNVYAMHNDQAYMMSEDDGRFYPIDEYGEWETDTPASEETSWERAVNDAAAQRAVSQAYEEAQDGATEQLLAGLYAQAQKALAGRTDLTAEEVVRAQLQSGDYRSEPDADAAGRAVAQIDKLDGFLASKLDVRDDVGHDKIRQWATEKGIHRMDPAQLAREIRYHDAGDGSAGGGYKPLIRDSMDQAIADYVADRKIANKNGGGSAAPANPPADTTPLPEDNRSPQQVKTDTLLAEFQAEYTAANQKVYPTFVTPGKAEDN